MLTKNIHIHTQEEVFQTVENATEYLSSNPDYSNIRAIFNHLLILDSPELLYKLNYAAGVVKIAADEIGLDMDSITGALLHFLSSNIDAENKILISRIGETPKQISKKLSQIEALRMDKISIMPENFIQLLLKISDDVRVILLLLADKIYCMRNITSFDESKQRKISTETTSLYIPLAHRLGLYKIKEELEVLAMQYNLPDVFIAIQKKIKESKSEQDKFFKTFTRPISESLNQVNLKNEIKYRIKSIPSIYSKMKKQGIDFDEVFDFFAIRIILDSAISDEKSDCWKAYSIVTDKYPPNTKRLRDWISVPRENGYESLHVTVDGPQGKSVEVQIRTQRMDENAEKGLAAHWRYKEQKGDKSSIDRWLKDIRDKLENFLPGEGDLASSSGLKLLEENIFVFTPDGDLKKLRTGATVLDFAFEIHTKIGQHCNGAKVNNLYVPLKHVLHTGDKVEIITSKNQKPNIDWLNWATTSRALTKIRRILKDAEYFQSDNGKEILIRKLNQIKIEYSDDIGSKLVAFYKAESALDLFHGFAEGKYDIQKLKEAFVGPPKTEDPKIAPKINTKSIDLSHKHSKPLVIINDSTPMADVHLARCCQPVSGDEIFGFVTVTEGIKIHRTDCTNAKQMNERYRYRIVKARWAELSELSSYVATIRISGFDQVGILNDITHAVSADLNTNIRSINLTSNNGKFEGTIIVNVDGKTHLSLILARLSKLKGVKKAVREH